MKNILRLCLLLFGIGTLSAQEDSTKIAFVAYWWKGDTYHYKVTKSSQKFINDTLTGNSSSSYNATFKVIDSTAKSYTIKWAWTNAHLDNIDLPKEILDEGINDSLNAITYLTSETGEFQEILNWQDASKSFIKMLDNATAFTIKNKKIKDTIKFKSVINTFKNTYSTKQGIEQYVLKEIELMHFFMGYEFDINKNTGYEEQFPNLMGGKPLIANTTIKFYNIDRENGRCNIDKTSVINKDDVKQMMISNLIKMGIPEDKVNSELENATASISHNYTYDFYYNPGVLVTLDYRRIVEVKSKNKSNKKIESIKIDMLDD
ncbi:hypothetical protein ACG2LH_05440 [Zhouia sp. PK063]|uniref:hypothetical protein n=1 Tax=Zhouia sp. PK063 TaxID=3373602 RepID=UPI0037A98EF9